MNYPQLWRTSGIALSLILVTFAAPCAQAVGHTVRSGETFTSIAKKYKISVATLQKANPKVKPGVIAKGQSLSLPDAAAKPVPLAAKTTKPLPPKNKTLSTSKSQKAAPTPEAAPRLTAQKKSAKRPPVTPITTYRVRPGDTATSLARRSGISVGDLAEMNGLEQIDLQEGQKLILPATALPSVSAADRENTVDLTPPTRRSKTPDLPARRPSPTPNPPTSPGTYYHVVKRGDTFSSIAREQGVSVTALTKSNRAVNPARLTVGQNLNIPGVQVASRQTSDETIEDSPSARTTAYRINTPEAEAPEAESTIPSIAYRITSRDSAETLAREFSTTAADLRHLNQMGPFDQFKTGDYIRIPWQNSSHAN